jgi:hypothetical protein
VGKKKKTKKKKKQKMLIKKKRKKKKKKIQELSPSVDHLPLPALPCLPFLNFPCISTLLQYQLIHDDGSIQVMMHARAIISSAELILRQI